jgi:hypothetical protein
VVPMEWALTAVVLGSVSVLVVTLTMEQHGQALGQRNGFALSRRRIFFLRVLLVARAFGITAGHQARSAAEVALRRLTTLSVSVAHVSRAAVQARLRPRDAAPATAPVRRGLRRTRSLRFEECLQTTGPEFVHRSEARSLSLASMPASTGWISRAVSMVELVAVIVVAGGAIALALFAVGWRAARLF